MEYFWPAGFGVQIVKPVRPRSAWENKAFLFQFFQSAVPPQHSRPILFLAIPLYNPTPSKRLVFILFFFFLLHLPSYSPSPTGPPPWSLWFYLLYVGQQQQQTALFHVCVRLCVSNWQIQTKHLKCGRGRWRRCNLKECGQQVTSDLL